MVDPYRQWLGVRQSQRPLTACQLLGLNRHDNDTAAIQQAANKKRAALMMWRSQADPNVWRRVHNELEKAVMDLTEQAKQDAAKAAVQLMAQQQKQDSNGRASSESVTCIQCRAACRKEATFCPTCGCNLWGSCPSCQTKGPISDRFCANCALDIEEVMTLKRDKVERAVAEATALKGEHRLPEARELLGSLGDLKHPRLADKAPIVTKLLAELEEAVQRHRQRAIRIETLATRCTDRNRNRRALRLIESVPASLRPVNLRVMTESVKARVDECNTLRAEIRKLRQGGADLDALISKMTQLSKMEPDDAKVLKAIDVLNKKIGADRADQAVKLHAAARKELAVGRYEAAAKLTRQIHETARTEQILRLSRFAEETAWLHWNLRTAPMIDDTLLALANRLVRLAPKDPRAAALEKKIAERIETNAGSDRFPSWAKPPEKTALGPPCLPLEKPRKMRVSDECDAVMFQQPARFAVACGLALAAGGRDAISVRLALEETGFSLTNWSRKSETVWGIDVSGSSLKAIQLELGSKDQMPIIRHVEVIDYADYEEHSLHDPSWHNRCLRRAIVELAGRHNLKKARIATALTGGQALSRLISLPDAAPKKQQLALEYEVVHKIPFPEEELEFDYETVQPPHDNDTRKTHYFLLAARRYHILNLHESFAEAGLKLSVVQTDSVALNNYLHWENFGERTEKANTNTEQDAKNQNKMVAAIDIGSAGTNVVVTHPEDIWIRHIPMGMEQLADAIVKECGLTKRQALKIVTDPLKFKTLSRLYSAFQPPLEQLIREIRLSLVAYAQQYPQEPITKIAMAGGGSYTHGVLGHLWWGQSVP